MGVIVIATALLDSKNDRIVLETLWRERELCKEAGAKYDEKIRKWWLPLSWATCCVVRGVWGDGLEIDASLNEWAYNDIRGRVQPCMELRDAEDFDQTLLANGHLLEPRQRAGSAFLIKAERALLGDAPGSGKTIQAICTLETMHEQGLEPYPALVISTNTMCYTWEAELKKWAPDRKVVVVKGTATKRRKLLEEGADVFVMNWEGLRGHTRIAGFGSIRLNAKEREEKELNAIKLRTVVADEVHRGKNPRALQTRAWWYLSHRARYSIGMTGTPIVRSPEDLWSIMHGIAPREWMSKSAWVDRYGLMSWGLWGGMEVVGLRGDTKDELFKYLDPRFIRRPTNVVVPNISEKLKPQVREVDMPTKQARAYKQMRDNMIAELDGGILTATQQLAKTTRLIQLASAFGEIDEDDKLTLTEPSCKVDALMDLVDEMDGEPIVVFAESRQLIELGSRKLEKQKIEHGMITGKISEIDRSTAISRFQDGELPVIMCTFGAGGEGITLTRARHAVFLQRSWSLAKNLQATDRVWRRGQDRPVQPIWIVTRDTIENRVLALGEQREVTFEEVCRDSAFLKKLIT